MKVYSMAQAANIFAVRYNSGDSSAICYWRKVIGLMMKNKGNVSCLIIRRK